jgi:hypothetical protein
MWMMAHGVYTYVVARLRLSLPCTAGGSSKQRWRRMVWRPGRQAARPRRERHDAKLCPGGRPRLEHHASKRNRRNDQRTRRTNPTNFEGVAANYDNLTHHHVLEVELDQGHIWVQGFDEMVTEGVKIWWWTQVYGWGWHGRCGLYMAYLKKVWERKRWGMARDARCSCLFVFRWTEERDRDVYVDGRHSGRLCGWTG